MKRFPHSHPVANNAVAMGVGALLLLGGSFIAGEPWAVPELLPTLIGLAYVVLLGTVIVFTLYLFVIDRWTASATSYSFLLMPLVSVVAAGIILGEPLTPALVVGGALVLVGVYLGAFAPSLARPLPGLQRHREPVTAELPPTNEPPTLVTPNCP